MALEALNSRVPEFFNTIGRKRTRLNSSGSKQPRNPPLPGKQQRHDHQLHHEGELESDRRHPGVSDREKPRQAPDNDYTREYQEHLGSTFDTRD